MNVFVYPTKIYGRVQVITQERTKTRVISLSVKSSVFEGHEAYESSAARVLPRLIDTADRLYPGLKREMDECDRRGTNYNENQRWKKK